MSDESRERVEHQKNWVQTRAKCTIQGVFCQIVDTVKCDVQRFNKLPEHQRRGLHFGHHQPDDGSVAIGIKTQDGIYRSDVVWIRHDSIGIRVSRNEDTMFEIERAWNSETFICDLLIDGKACSLWRISQKAIGDLLFETT